MKSVVQILPGYVKVTNKTIISIEEVLKNKNIRTQSWEDQTLSRIKYVWQNLGKNYKRKKLGKLIVFFNERAKGKTDTTKKPKRNIKARNEIS